MVIGSDDITHGAYIWMIEQRDDCRFSSCPDLFRLICSFALTVALMLIGRQSRNDFDGNLKAFHISAIVEKSYTIDLIKRAGLPVHPFQDFLPA